MGIWNWSTKRPHIAAAGPNITVVMIISRTDPWQTRCEQIMTYANAYSGKGPWKRHERGGQYWGNGETRWPSSHWRHTSSWNHFFMPSAGPHQVHTLKALLHLVSLFRARRWRSLLCSFIAAAWKSSLSLVSRVAHRLTNLEKKKFGCTSASKRCSKKKRKTKKTDQCLSSSGWPTSHRGASQESKLRRPSGRIWLSSKEWLGGGAAHSAALCHAALRPLEQNLHSTSLADFPSWGETRPLCGWRGGWSNNLWQQRKGPERYDTG